MPTIDDLDELAALVERTGRDGELYVRWSRLAAGVRPWVLLGDQHGRGPDNEPLVVCRRPVTWVSEQALRQSEKAVRQQGPDEWGPLDRTSPLPPEAD
jgi:hypothetical protein